MAWHYDWYRNSPPDRHIQDDRAENIVMYTLFECDPSMFGFGGSTEDTGMMILDIILWVPK